MKDRMRRWRKHQFLGHKLVLAAVPTGQERPLTKAHGQGLLLTAMRAPATLEPSPAWGPLTQLVPRLAPSTTALPPGGLQPQPVGQPRGAHSSCALFLLFSIPVLEAHFLCANVRNLSTEV